MHQDMAALSSRGPSGSGKVIFAPNSFAKVLASEDGGGDTAYGLMTDFMRILESLMTDDGKLLRPETLDLMFKPQLEGFNKNRTNSHAPKIGIPDIYTKFGGFAEGTAKD
ncbi:hypothetical protein MMC14_005001 [Varicellaria rhodocarpa]|nr:hypothetical protein [Varicellaria rhodocarpa]